MTEPIYVLAGGPRVVSFGLGAEGQLRIWTNKCESTPRARVQHLTYTAQGSSLMYVFDVTGPWFIFSPRKDENISV